MRRYGCCCHQPHCRRHSSFLTWPHYGYSDEMAKRRNIRNLKSALTKFMSVCSGGTRLLARCLLIRIFSRRKFFALLSRLCSLAIIYGIFLHTSSFAQPLTFAVRRDWLLSMFQTKLSKGFRSLSFGHRSHFFSFSRQIKTFLLKTRKQIIIQIKNANPNS